MSESQSAGVELIACEMPGCRHVVEYGGVGRKPKYCNRVVDGVMHNRLNAQKVRNGILTLPAPGSRPECSDDGGDGSGSSPRPVSLARAGIEAVRDEITTQLAAHQSWMTGAAARLEELFAAATDPDAAATEVAAAHREARTRIDAAEAATEDALARARAAETEAAAEATGRAEAETAAEDALAERDELTEQRDRYAGLLADRATELDRVTAELAELRQAHENLGAQHQRAQAERDTARSELTAARDDAAAQRQRAETLDRGRYAAEQARDGLAAELANARARADELAQAAAEARTAQAVTAAENTALTRQLEHDVAGERAHGEQRLADLRERHAEELRALRERTDVPAPPAPPDPGTAEGDPGAAATRNTEASTTRRRTSPARSPRKARRRAGPEQTSDPQE